MKLKDIEDTRQRLKNQEQQAQAQIEETKTKLIQLESCLRDEEKRFSEVSLELDLAMKKVEELTKAKKDVAEKSANIHSTIGSSTTLLQKLVSDVASYKKSMKLADEAAASQGVVLQEAKRKLMLPNFPSLGK